MTAHQHSDTHGFFERHHAKIEFGAPSGCWLWSGSKFSNGYGKVKMRGKTLRAHRVSYEAENGKGSAADLLVRHKCDTPLCVNPAHLEIGTSADNSRDMMVRGRHRYILPDNKGAANGNAKLTDADVAAIRSIYVAGSRLHGQFALARRFGVGKALIGQIVRRERWTHVS